MLPGDVGSCCEPLKSAGFSGDGKENVGPGCGVQCVREEAAMFTPTSQSDTKSTSLSKHFIGSP